MKKLIFIICLQLGFGLEAFCLQNDTTVKASPDSTHSLIKKDSIISSPAVNDVKVVNVEEKTSYDTIFKKSEFAIVCKVLEKNLYEVKYIKKGEKLERKISTRELKSIHYSNGKIDLIDNNPEKAKKNWVTQSAEVEWKRVKTFKNEADVAGMVEKGTVEAVYEAAKITMGNDVLERNAIAILQKKALLLKANAILITGKDIRREYGEIPSIRMTAIAYSKE